MGLSRLCSLVSVIVLESPYLASQSHLASAFLFSSRALCFHLNIIAWFSPFVGSFGSPHGSWNHLPVSREL